MSLLPTKPTRHSAFRSLGLFILLVSLISCTSLLALWTFGPRSIRAGWTRWGHSRSSTATQIVGPTPRQKLAIDQRKTTIFRDYPEFMNVSREFDRVWEGALPPNGGWLRVADAVEGKDIWFTVSMFHQLHCLQGLRMTLQHVVEEVNLLRGELRVMSAEDGAKSQRGRDADDDVEHAMHCLDYLRQVILRRCACGNPDGT
jgi:hypothetical protein